MKNETKKYLWIAVAGTIVQFILFKLLYPFPDFSASSHDYIYAASSGLNISIEPIGYSKFLAAFHYITYSDTALVGFQYFFIELAAFYFFYTFRSLYHPARNTTNILFIFLFFNPLFLYLGNYISNDPLFFGMSLLWFTQLLWVIYSPMLSQLLTHSILLFLCITLSHNSYYYFIISAIAFSLSSQRLPLKIIGISLPILLILPFVFFTRNAALKITGEKQYALSTGWQLANNALYMFEYTDSVRFATAELREIDNLTRNFYNSAPRNVYEQLGSYPGNYFVQDSLSPLNTYVRQRYKNDGDSGGLLAFSKASSLFRKYGSYQISHNPAAYFWEYILPNSWHYLLPHLEILRIYNQGQEKIDLLIQNWFHYKTDKLNVASTQLQGILVSIFPVLFFIINIFLSVSGVWLLAKKEFKRSSMKFKNSTVLTFSLWIINLLGSIISGAIVLRHQLLPLIIFLSFSLLLVDFIDEKRMQEQHKNIRRSKLSFDK